MFYQIIQITKNGEVVNDIVAECFSSKEADVTRAMYAGINNESFIIKRVEGE